MFQPGVAFPESGRRAGENGLVRPHDLRIAAAGLCAGAAVLTLLPGCAPGAPAGANPTPSTLPSTATDPRGQLAAMAATAKDRRYVVGYTYSQPNQPLRSVLVTIATDDTWRVDIQGGALGGTVDVSIASRPEGLYQCTLNADAICVRVASAGRKLPPAIDPKAQYPFTSWLDVFVDRQVPLSVLPAAPQAGETGSCFSVDPAVTAIAPPIDAGVFCFATDGTPTVARLPWGTLVMAGQPSPPPPTVSLPGPVSEAVPLPTSPPPPPSPTPSQ
jgi:hypothetical protein